MPRKSKAEKFKDEDLVEELARAFFKDDSEKDTEDQDRSFGDRIDVMRNVRMTQYIADVQELHRLKKQVKQDKEQIKKLKKKLYPKNINLKKGMEGLDKDAINSNELDMLLQNHNPKFFDI